MRLRIATEFGFHFFAARSHALARVCVCVVWCFCYFIFSIFKIYSLHILYSSCQVHSIKDRYTAFCTIKNIYFFPVVCLCVCCFCSVMFFQRTFLFQPNFFYCINFCKLNDNRTCCGSFGGRAWKSSWGWTEAAYNAEWSAKIRRDIFGFFSIRSFSVNESFESFMCVQVFGFSHIYYLFISLLTVRFRHVRRASNAI